MTSSLRAVMAIGLVTLAGTIGVVLSRSPITVAGTNSVVATVGLGEAEGGEGACQNGGTYPAHVTAIRVSLSANVGPGVRVRVEQGSRVLAEGTHPSGWGVDETVTVPMRPLSHSVHDPTICTTVSGPVQVNGSPKPGGGVSLRMEYLRPGGGSWLSRVPAIARRLGLGHAAAGTWIAFLLLALAGALVALVIQATLREPQ
jgi:hypothetical protein